jgi:Polyketide cyclase / dehydrase and lipid transport
MAARGGPRADYEFLTAWLIRAPIEAVWDQLFDVATWPEWWRGVTEARELEQGGPDGVGKVFTISWRSFLPYDLTFVTTVTQVEKPHLMVGEARGELTGTGRWRLFNHDGVTAVTYEWNVRTTKAWMNALAPLARPVFEWNHDYVMRRGGEGLKSRLDMFMKTPSG